MSKRYDDDYDSRGTRPVRKKSAAGSSQGRRSQGKKKSRSSAADGTRKSTAAKRSSNAKARAAKKRKRFIIFGVEIAVLLVMVGVLFLVLKLKDMDKVDIEKGDIVINEEVQQKIEAAQASGEEAKILQYRNIALFGVDSREGALNSNTRTDTIMIASINNETGEVKLCSIYRDTYMNLGNDTYNKCNSAYAKGGPEQAINMLNMNLDLNITDYVTVGFAGMVDTIDALGGVMVDVDNSEISHLNNYQISISEDLGRRYTALQNTGYQELNGLQATAYCRIRYTKGDDFKRAERQREVLMAIVDQAKKANVSTLNSVANSTIKQVSTSLDISEIISLLGDVTKYSVVADDGFPFESNRATGNIGSKGSCVVPTDLATNVTLLHEFLFEEENYDPSDSVKQYSQKIQSDTASYIR